MIRTVLAALDGTVIVEAGDRLDVDLVVVGSHLYHWPDRLLGTVAANLANRGHRNVLVVRS